MTRTMLLTAVSVDVDEYCRHEEHERDGYQSNQCPDMLINPKSNS